MENQEKPERPKLQTVKEFSSFFPGDIVLVCILFVLLIVSMKQLVVNSMKPQIPTLASGSVVLKNHIATHVSDLDEKQCDDLMFDELRMMERQTIALEKIASFVTTIICIRLYSEYYPPLDPNKEVVYDTATHSVSKR